MTRLLIFALLLIFNNTFAQKEDKKDCRIEFFLLKSVKPNIDTTIKLKAQFSIGINDLEDTAFIKNHEILGYAFKKDNVKSKGSILTDNSQVFEVALSAAGRINNLEIPLCCGRQFALVVNGVIVYSGYFWNLLSSFGSEYITAFAYGTKIKISRKLPDYDFAIDSEDPRLNNDLLDCLLQTNRLNK